LLVNLHLSVVFAAHWDGWLFREDSPHDLDGCGNLKAGDENNEMHTECGLETLVSHEGMI